MQAAEASIAPVRLGVAKPLGASSVASEYQQTLPYGYSPSSYSRRCVGQAYMCFPVLFCVSQFCFVFFGNRVVCFCL